MPTPDNLKGFDIVYDPNRNLYADNSRNISDSEEISVDVGNITFRVVYRSFRFGERIFKQNTQFSHTHPYCELHIFRLGETEMIFEESAVNLSSHDTLLVFPNTYHYYKASELPFEISNISFYISKNKQKSYPDYYERFTNLMNESPGYMLFRNTTNIVDYITKLSEYSELNTPLFLYFHKTLMGLVFAELVLNVCNGIEISLPNSNAISEHDLRMQTIQYYFIWHHDEDITLKQLAHAVRLSEKQTGRIIKKYYGVDFKTHLSNIRLKNSKKLLKETSMEIRDVATTVGFKSYNGYYIAFKKAFGLTPNEYRKKSKER